MDIQKIYQYKSAFDLIAKSIKDDEGNTIEVWYARELQQVLGYARWENSVVALVVPWNRVRHWGTMWMTIFVRSRKWSSLAVVHSAKFKTSCSRDMPDVFSNNWAKTMNNI